MKQYEETHRFKIQAAKIQSLEQEVARLKEENLKLNEYKFMYEGLCK